LQKLKEDLSVEYKHEGQELPSGPIGNGTADSNSIRPNGRERIWTGAYETTIPRSKPLSPGEILGCTAPFLKDVDALMSVPSFQLYAHPHTVPDTLATVAFT
jgi:2-(3-amino-3-carboxypropyl)histidine synthase